jgi:hypothetical protein
MHREFIAAAAAVLLAGAAVGAQQQKIGAPPESKDMALVGYNDLQARSVYQPTIHRQGGRYIAYLGHHGGEKMNPLTGQVEMNGTSIVDVTDPKNPRYLAHIPGEKGAGEQGGAQMTRVCSGSRLPNADKSKEYLLRSYGLSAHEIWDVTDPSKPTKVVTVVDGLRNTHKSEWECDTGIAYVVSGPKDWRVRRMTKIYDLSNPAKPVFIRDFGLPGQQPGSAGVAPTELHGPISLGPSGNRIYFGYGTARAGVAQIVDRDKLLNGPKEPTDANLLYPQITRIDLPPDAGAHTALPLLGMNLQEFAKQRPPANAPVPGGGHSHGASIPSLATGQAHRDFLAVVSESLEEECMEARQMVRLIDITYEDKPIGASTWTVPEASGNFCERGGRFGAHSAPENFTPIYYGRVLFVTFFNAGLRALDIRDPYNIKEIAYFIPAITANTEERCVGEGAQRRCKVAIQSNNVEVDDRGYVYVGDRANTGLHILELTGAARRVANFAVTSSQ